MDIDGLIRKEAADTLIDDNGNTMAYMIMRDTLNDLIASRLTAGPNTTLQAINPTYQDRRSRVSI